MTALLVAGGSPSAQPVMLDFTTKYNRRKHSGVLVPSTLRIGNASARLNRGAIGDVIGAITGGGKSSSKSRSQRIPFLVEGTTSDPRFVADVSGLVMPALMNQLGNVNVPAPASGRHERGDDPLGAIKDLFKKGR